MKRVIVTGFLILMFIFCFGVLAQAADVTLAWNANSESNLGGYKLYYETTEDATYGGTGLVEGDSPVTIYLTSEGGEAYLEDASSPTFTLTGLTEDITYTFALTAFDTDGLESDFSDTVSYTVNEVGPAKPTGFKRIVTLVVSWLKSLFSSSLRLA